MTFETLYHGQYHIVKGCDIAKSVSVCLVAFINLMFVQLVACVDPGGTTKIC